MSEFERLLDELTNGCRHGGPLNDYDKRRRAGRGGGSEHVPHGQPDHPDRQMTKRRIAKEPRRFWSDQERAYGRFLR